MNARIADAIEAIPGGLDDAVVRLVVRNIPRHVSRDLDHKAIRDYKRRALHFQLDTRKPELVRALKGSGAGGARPSLAMQVRDKLESRPISSDVDRTVFVQLGMEYLQRVSEPVTATLEPFVDAAEIVSPSGPDDAFDSEGDAIVRLRTLRLQNFRQHADTRIEFELGLTGIIGMNGAGKSTILEAIAWALYGNTMARGTRESIKFHGARPRAAVRVELEFDLGPHQYRVVRGLTSAELFVDARASPMANSIGAVGQVIEQRLGMTSREFHTTYFTRQKDLAAMASMGATDRGKFLSRVLGYDRLQKAQELVRLRRSEVIAALKALSQSMADAEQLAADVTAATTSVRAAERALQAAAAALRTAEQRALAAEPQWLASQTALVRDGELHTAIVRAEGQVEAARKDVLQTQQAVDESERCVPARRRAGAACAAGGAARRAAATRGTLAQAARHQALAEEVARLTAAVDAAAERLATLAQAPALRSEVEQALRAARTTAAASVEAATAKRTDWVRVKQEAETRRSQLREQFAELKLQRETLERLGPVAPCPTCTRPLGDENYAALLEDLGTHGVAPRGRRVLQAARGAAHAGARGASHARCRTRRTRGGGEGPRTA